MAWADWRCLPGQLRELTWRERVFAVRAALEPAERRRARLQRVLTGDAASGEPQLVFVCYGNIMRSAFAAAWSRQARPEVSARVSSAGTNAKAGREAEATARRVAMQCGVELDAHRATPLPARPVHPADVYVCMDWLNVGRACVQLPAAMHARVFLIGDIGAEARVLRDPYGRGEHHTAAAFTWLRTATDRWLSLLFAPRER